jgi:hypothetical protein
MSSQDIDQYSAALRLLKVSEAWVAKDLVESLEFKGFDRRKFFAQLIKQRIRLKTAAWLAVLGALRGNNFSKWEDQIPWDECGYPNIKAKLSKNIVGSRGKAGEVALTLSRFTSAMPEVVAFILKEASVDKRLEVECPAFLQFPGAASLPLKQDVRLQHKMFSQQFSRLLPGATTANQDQVYDSIARRAIPWKELNHEAREALKQYLEVPAETQELRDEFRAQMMVDRTLADNSEDGLPKLHPEQSVAEASTSSTATQKSK